MAKKNKKEQDLVSIIIPVYNTGKYLEPCLKSCADQTYKNLEIIVVDDCSTDPYTLSLLKEYEAKDPRFKVIYVTPNQGQGHCRNVGFDACHGKYFSFVDSDDFLSPDNIERLVNGIKEFKTDFVICDIKKEFGSIDDSVADNGVTVNIAESQFNLLHAKDRSVLKTSFIIDNDCLGIFPATCYGKLFNAQAYRDANIRFATGYEARKCQDQDWKYNILLQLKDVLILKFVGYTRVVHADSVSAPSLHHTQCSIAANHRIYQLLKGHPIFEKVASDLVCQMITISGDMCCFTPNFADRQKLVELISNYVNKTDKSFNLNPFVFNWAASKHWNDFFKFMDSKPIQVMFYSQRPLHDVLSSDVCYLRELLEGFRCHGAMVNAVSGLWSENKTPLLFLQEYMNSLLKSNIDQQKIAQINSSLFMAFFDNAIYYITPKTSRNDLNKLTPLELRIFFNTVQQALEQSFKRQYLFMAVDKKRLLEFQYNIHEIENDENTFYFNRLRALTKGEKETPLSEPEITKSPKLVLVTGGDLVSQQVYRNLKTSGCKVIYLVNDENSVEFATKDGSYNEAVYKQSLNLISEDRQALAEAFTAHSLASFYYNKSVQNLEIAEEKFKFADLDPNINRAKLPTPEKMAEYRKEVERTKKEMDETQAKVSALQEKKINPPQFSEVDPNYIFAPAEFDAVFSFRHDLAQRFANVNKVQAKTLGYVMNNYVNIVANKDPQIIAFPHPVLENGLAIFIKLMHAYTQRHPETKFTVVQDSEDTFIQDLNKLHDKEGNSIAKLKLNLSSMIVSTSDKLNPIDICESMKVLLKLGLNDKAAVCNIPEALLNNIPVLATNQSKYIELVGEGGKILAVPETTLQDPSCLPTDEEIIPYVEALEELMSTDMRAQVAKAAVKFDFTHNVDAWMHEFYDLLDLPYTHDHETDRRKI